MKPPLLSLKNLTKYFLQEGREVAALQNVSLSLEEGEIFGLIGGSGSGKSTLTRLILGLETPSSGALLISNHPISSIQRSTIGAVFQDFNLLDSRTALENVAFPLTIQKQKDAYHRAFELLELVGLSEKKNLYPAQLSGGQKQRVAIARALATKPKLLLCDEATSSLDPESTHNILELLEKLNRELNLSILLITHEMDVVKALCHRVGVLDKGQLIEYGTVDQLVARPLQEVTRSYLEPYSTRSFKKYFSNHKETIWRLCFLGESAKRPLINYLITSFSIQINILMGKIDYVRGALVGTLVVEVTGSDKKGARLWLESQNVHVEEVTHAN